MAHVLEPLEGMDKVSSHSEMEALQFLRARAEALLHKKRDLEPGMPMERLLEEIQVYQIELEMQNEELRRTTTQLTHARQEMATLFDEAPMAYLTVDSLGWIKRANYRASTQFNIPGPGEIEVEHIRLKSLVSDSGWLWLTQHLLSKQQFNQVIRGELEFKNRSGHRWPGVVEGRWLHQGQESLLLLATRNISVLQETKAQRERAVKDFANLISNLPDALFVLRDGHIRYANEMASALLCQPAFTLQGLPFTDFIHPSEFPSFAQWLKAPEGHAEEFTVTDATGRTVPTEFRRMNGLFEEEPAVLLLVRDLQHQRQLEAQIAQKNRMAAVGMLVAGVAHEINNPLAYMLNALEVMRFNLDKGDALNLAEINEMLEVAHDGGRRVARIVSELRTLYVDRDDAPPIECSVNTLIQDLLRVLHPKMDYQARVSSILGRVSNITVQRDRLSQVLLNLVTNAAQAMPEGRPPAENLVQLRTWERGNVVHIAISDNGVGIEKKDIGQIFDPFFTTRHTIGGTGMGLSLCQTFIQQFGGWLTVDSTPGEGSTFTIHIPITATPTHVESDSAPPQERGHLGRILIVDDEPFIRTTLARLLESVSEPLTVSSAPEAIRILTEDEGLRFDLILCDWWIPEGGGDVLLPWLKTHRPEQSRRTLLMTGLGHIDSPEIGEVAEARPVLGKPFTLDQLYSAVATLTH